MKLANSHWWCNMLTVTIQGSSHVSLCCHHFREKETLRKVLAPDWKQLAAARLKAVVVHFSCQTITNRISSYVLSWCMESYREVVYLPQDHRFRLCVSVSVCFCCCEGTLTTMDSDLILTERTGCVMELRGSNQNTLDTILGCVMSQNVECYFFCAV